MGLATTAVTTRQRLLSVLAGCLCSVAGGCGSLTMFQSVEMPEATAPSQGTVHVEVRESGKEPKMAEMPLTGDMFVQQAVDFSRARRKFRRMHVTILRTTPDGRPHRMECQYELAKRRVSPEFDYALFPGDRVIISEDTSNIFDDILDKAGGSMGAFSR